MKTALYKLIPLLLLVNAFASAQTRFSVAITASPAYAHFNTSLNLLVPDGNGQIQPINLSNKSSSAGFLTGFMMHYAFTPRWSVSSGLWYNRLGADGINPFVPGNFPARIISQNLQIPLLVNLRLNSRRLSPYFSLGSLANFPQSTLYRSETNAGTDKTSIRFNTPADFRAVVGAGVSYQLAQHWSLLFQPQLVWHFQPKGDYERFIAYQLNGHFQLMYSF
ncbi:outer membrane beta-barrel protein [Spirosoma sp.]|uniref:outer membrane beta-barrel protein n=1 Tax=Spirosoma sp. TaxID=1899569 RepID=UPI003B3B3A03